MLYVYNAIESNQNWDSFAFKLPQYFYVLHIDFSLKQSKAFSNYTPWDPNIINGTTFSRIQYDDNFLSAFIGFWFFFFHLLFSNKFTIKFLSDFVASLFISFSYNVIVLSVGAFYYWFHAYWFHSLYANGQLYKKKKKLLVSINYEITQPQIKLYIFCLIFVC